MCVFITTNNKNTMIMCLKQNQAPDKQLDVLLLGRRPVRRLRQQHLGGKQRIMHML